MYLKKAFTYLKVFHNHKSFNVIKLMPGTVLFVLPRRICKLIVSAVAAAVCSNYPYLLKLFDIEIIQNITVLSSNA